MAVAKKAVTKAKPRSSKAVQVVDDLFGGDTELALFFSAWLETDRNATKAMLRIRPDSTYGTAAILGHRMLKKVNKDVVFEHYKLNFDRYLTKIDRGLEAKKRDQYTGEETDDHATQIKYHDKLGELLELEGKAAQLTINNTQNNLTITPILGSGNALPGDDGDPQGTGA